MSYVEIFRVSADGDVTSYDKSPNNHCGAPLIWQFLTVKYGVHPTGDPYEMPRPYDYESLWEVFDLGKMQRQDALVMGITSNRVWVPKEFFPELIEALLAFHERWIVPNNKQPTIKGIAEVLADLAEEGVARGATFNWCSADYPFWRYETDEGDEEVTRPYNIDRDTGHAILEIPVAKVTQNVEVTRP